MSLRPPVNRERIERFLRVLGERFKKPGRVYLVGGTTMVWEGFREQSLDVDVTFDVVTADHSSFVQVIAELKNKLSINVEEASPADFIPLPSGANERALFIGRFGSLDVFHFDLYSTALSKIARGTQEDLDDVLALVRAKRIERTALEKYYAEIKPRVASESLKQDPQEFERNFQTLWQLWARD